MDDEIKEFSDSIKDESDITRGIIELFKDIHNKDKGFDLEHHPVDIRTRLNATEIRGMSIINYFTSIKMDHLVPRKFFRDMKVDVRKDIELSHGLNLLTHHLKRHKYSYDGKSRNEIIELMKSKVESLTQGGDFRSIFGMGRK